MKNKASLFLATVALLCLAGWGVRAQKETPTRIAWEYISTNNPGEIHKLGAQGWELVGISDSVSGSVNGGYGSVGGQVSTTSWFYFKRVK